MKNRNAALLEFLNSRTYFVETVQGSSIFWTRIVNCRIWGFRPFFALFLRVPFLRENLLQVDWKTSERILEYPWLYRHLGKLSDVFKVLDIGCASSRTSMELANMGFQVTGVDMRDYPLAHPCFRFVKSDICRMPFENGYFDMVLCVSTLEHIGIASYNIPGFPDGDRKALAEIHRNLRPGGYLYLTVPFGTAADTWQRIYDYRRLNDVLRGFKVLDSRFFSRSEGKHWAPTSPEELEKIPSPPDQGVNGVAILLCQRV